jgi:hypothetical protein
MRAHFHTRKIVPRLKAARIALIAQNEPATPSGTSAKVISVNSGPYGLSSWCQFDK